MLLSSTRAASRSADWATLPMPTPLSDGGEPGATIPGGVTSHALELIPRDCSLHATCLRKDSRKLHS